MTRRPVHFGLGDLETRLAAVLEETEFPGTGDTPPVGRHTFVHTGEVAVARESTLFSTVLGSCVSICLWDPRTKIGGMNHFLLPDQVSNGLSSPRFGNVALRTLLSRLDSYGATTTALHAKIFGGSAVLNPRIKGSDDVGSRNVDLARVLLGLAGIPIESEDVGGQQGRKLIFRSNDGAAWVRKL